MTQLGEGIDIGMFVGDDNAHSESTCPWHKKSNASATEMEEQAPDEDTHGAIPANLGSKLGENMNAANTPPPSANKVWIPYQPFGTVAYMEAGRRKRVQVYEQVSADEYEYPLQYAPHHLIPGNESLKGSKIVPFMGDNTVISKYKKGQATKIKTGYSIGYNVNDAKNGVWLPSPYALSNSNVWPSIPGIKAILKRKGVAFADETEEFKQAYASAAIEIAGNRQFHMRHEDYSREVRKILDAMAAKIKLLAAKCAKAQDGEEDGKFEPPYALKDKLHGLSSRLRRLLIGPTWREPLFTDDLTVEYTKSLKKVRASTRGLRVM